MMVLRPSRAVWERAKMLLKDPVRKDPKLGRCGAAERVALWIQRRRTPQ